MAADSAGTCGISRCRLHRCRDGGRFGLDNNGNLTLIIPPGGSSWLHYGYDQRNLLISHTLSVSGTNPQLQAAYVYDGAGNRVQQVDDMGASPATTTYINDIVGLTQVLLADDGTEQVYNLFGLDLIAQDEGTDTRYLLADGLGSVRAEMVDGDVASVTTYDPYGNLLTQMGDSGTTYGYSGEQYDGATGLLYLRARYYNPALRSFMGRDPWSGNGKRPQSMNGWGYVENNPINLSDPTGSTPFRAEYCKTKDSFYQYRDCVLNEYHLDWDLDIEIANFDYQGEPNCWFGPIPYRASGYLEGISSSISIIGGWTGGYETVYDFATMERQTFRFDGIVGQTLIGGGIVQSIGEISGFRSWRTDPTFPAIETDYRGWFKSRFAGTSLTLFGIPGTDIGVGFSAGKAWFEGMPDFTIGGSSWYFGIGGGIGLPWPLEGGVTATKYRPLDDNEQYWALDSHGRKFVTNLIHNDILRGKKTPWIWPPQDYVFGIRPDTWLRTHLTGVSAETLYQVYLYNQINRDSYGPGDAIPKSPPQ